jgi:hypothetical protein
MFVEASRRNDETSLVVLWSLGAVEGDGVGVGAGAALAPATPKRTTDAAMSAGKVTVSLTIEPPIRSDIGALSPE